MIHHTMKQAFPFLLIVLMISIILVSGCLNTSGTQASSDNSSDTPLSGTSLPTNPVVIITPNASNAGIDTRVYPPHHPPTIFIFSLPDAIDVLGESVFIPTELPAGYAYGGGSANTEGVVSLGISNGSDGILYLQVSPPRQVQGTISGSSIPISSNGIRGLCMTNGSQHQLSWSDETHDYYLSGTLPCGEYIRMAASLGPLNPETLEKVPWKELQPATPLPPSEILNLVFSREWLDSHDTNPDPQIFNVTMSSEDFNSSFSPDPVDPTLLRQKAVEDDKKVALFNMPKNMFAGFNDDSEKVKINFPDTFFRFYDSMDALHEDLNSRRAGTTAEGENMDITPRTIPSVIRTTSRIS
jgi:hypothetical protein